MAPGGEEGSQEEWHQAACLPGDPVQPPVQEGGPKLLPPVPGLCNAGVRSVYWGESGRSARQRHGEHAAGVERGDVANPLVYHSVECHGGKQPHFLALVNTIEPKPLYQAVREAVQITQMPPGTPKPK